MGRILRSDNKILKKLQDLLKLIIFAFFYGYSDLKYVVLILIDIVLLDQYYFLNNILKYLITLY